MSEQPSSVSSTADREIVGTRLFDAPRDLVFQMWIDPQHVGKWWGPNGFRITTHEMDVRPGGHWRFIMHGPDGTDYKNHVIYIEIARPHRLVYKHVPEPGTEFVGFETTVTFEDINGKTRLTMRALLPSAKAREFVITKFGAVEGMKQHLGRLDELLSQLTKEMS